MISLVSCDSGLPSCIVVAVLVASERFMSRVEKVVDPCEKGEDRGCCGTEDDDACDGGSSGGGED